MFKLAETKSGSVSTTRNSAGPARLQRMNKAAIFLHWPDNTGLTGQDVLSLAETDAFVLFLAIRWAENGGMPLCPRCGGQRPYSMRRRRYRCSEAACRSEFSATTGTVFASRKLSYKKIVTALWDHSVAEQGRPTLRLGKLLEVEYKTACSLRQKFRLMDTLKLG